MIKQKLKKCKGTGQATNWGCENEVIKRTYGLCDTCYYDWLVNSEPGKVKIQKATLKAKQDIKRKEKAELKKKKISIKTHSEWLQDLQKVFNQYIRKRDEKLPCVSCGTFNGQMHCGHFMAVSIKPQLRFTEDNCQKQCSRCNNYLSGNLIEYRKGLINRIGEERVKELENDHSILKLTIPEIKELIETYKSKIKQFIKTKQ